MQTSTGKQPVLCVLGPTASGKTGLSVELCKRDRYEVISVDSALVYKQMDIGTAKPDAETLSLAPHALINLVEPWESYSVARFLTDVNIEIKRIADAGRVPLLAGGTMLYYHALWNGLSTLPESDPATREKLQQTADSIGWVAMHKRLAKIDVVSAAKIHPNDPQRLLRALEVFELSGIPLSELQNRRTRNDQYDFFNVGLFPTDRALLHHRIAQRFSLMIEQGFTDEVRSLMQLPAMHVELASMRCVGYRQMWSYLSGEGSEQDMIDRGVAATRQLAKRQITWMRKMASLTLLDIPVSLHHLLDDTAYKEWSEKHRLSQSITPKQN